MQSKVTYGMRGREHLCGRGDIHHQTKRNTGIPGKDEGIPGHLLLFVALFLLTVLSAVQMIPEPVTWM